MGQRDDELRLTDTSRLTDADWAEINKFRRAYETGGERAVDEVYHDLARRDPLSYLRVIGAFFPAKVRNAIKDQMAAAGMTVEDLKEMMQKADQARTKH